MNWDSPTHSIFFFFCIPIKNELGGEWGNVFNTYSVQHTHTHTLCNIIPASYVEFFTNTRENRCKFWFSAGVDFIILLHEYVRFGDDSNVNEEWEQKVISHKTKKIIHRKGTVKGLLGTPLIQIYYIFQQRTEWGDDTNCYFVRVRDDFFFIIISLCCVIRSSFVVFIKKMFLFKWVR